MEHNNQNTQDSKDIEKPFKDAICATNDIAAALYKRFKNPDDWEEEHLEVCEEFYSLCLEFGEVLKEQKEALDATAGDTGLSCYNIPDDQNTDRPFSDLRKGLQAIADVLIIRLENANQWPSDHVNECAETLMDVCMAIPVTVLLEVALHESTSRR